MQNVIIVAAPTHKPPPLNDGLITMEGINTQKKMSTNTIALLLFIGYIMLGLIFYCYSASKLTALDAVYFSVITFATIGYGDTFVLNREFTTFYVLLGAGLVGSFFGIMSNDVMEFHEGVMKKRLVHVAIEMNKVVNKTTTTLKDYQKKTIIHFLEKLEQDPESSHHSSHGSVESHLEKAKNPTFRARISKMFLDRLHVDSGIKMKDMNLAIYEDELREIRSKGMVDGMFVVVSMLTGAICMMFIENWNFTDALYWAVVTMCTVGYGDVTPTTMHGKVFTIFYALVGCSLAAKGFRDIVTYPMVVKAKENELSITRQFGDELSEKTLREILGNEFFLRIPNLRRDEKQINKSEFVLLLLQMMGKVEDKDILLASKIFDKLDVECDGWLSEEDQEKEIKKARERDIIRAKAEAAARLQQMQEQAQQPRGLGTTISNAVFVGIDKLVNLGHTAGSALYGEVDTTDNNHQRNSSHDPVINPLQQRRDSSKSTHNSPLTSTKRTSFNENNRRRSTSNSASNSPNMNANNNANVNLNTDGSGSPVPEVQMDRLRSASHSSNKSNTSSNVNITTNTSNSTITAADTTTTAGLKGVAASNSGGSKVWGVLPSTSLESDLSHYSPIKTTEGGVGIGDEYAEFVDADQDEDYDPAEEAEIVESMLRLVNNQDHHNEGEDAAASASVDRAVTWGQDTAYSPITSGNGGKHTPNSSSGSDGSHGSGEFSGLDAV